MNPNPTRARVRRAPFFTSAVLVAIAQSACLLPVEDVDSYTDAPGETAEETAPANAAVDSLDGASERDDRPTPLEAEDVSDRSAPSDGPSPSTESPSALPVVPSEDSAAAATAAGAETEDGAAADGEPQLDATGVASEDELDANSAGEIDAEPACGPDIAGPAGQSCYLLAGAPLNWWDARAECSKWGGDLVVLDTPEEDAFVASLTTDTLWIGGSDLQVQDDFQWVDGTPMARDAERGHWGPAQPDSFAGQDCVESRTGEGWFDQSCFNTHAYLCERPAAD